MFTACHVVYDTNEAKRTEVDLFYDDKNSMVTTLYGFAVEDNSAQDDVCIMHCSTHDLNLIRSLENCLDEMDNLKGAMEGNLGDFWEHPLCAVISHPHGQPKKVTIGEIAGKATYNPKRSMMADYMFTYTSDTCKGSSGAPVLSLVSMLFDDSAVWPGTGPHSWGNVDGMLSQCGCGIFYAETGELKLNDLL